MILRLIEMGVTEIERKNAQLIKEGILSILRGEHGKLLFQKLLLILGDEFFEGIDENLMYQEEKGR